MKKRLIFGGIIILILIFLFLIPITKKSDNPYVLIGENRFNVELAINSEEQQTGLMFRESMSDDGGMFFIFDNSQILNFWMKNTFIPLDIIYIDENFEIVSIARNVPPCEGDPCESYSSGAEASYVLEINGGLSDELGIKEGDSVQLVTPPVGNRF